MKKLLLAMLTISLFAGCGEEEEKVVLTRPTGAEIEILYEMTGNTHKGKDQYMNEFILQNHSKYDLKNNWTIYFHQPNRLIEGSVTGPVKVQHISGDYYKITPSNNYDAIKAEGEIEFSFLNKDFMIKNSDFPTGFYVVFKDSLGKESTPEIITEVVYTPLTKMEQVSRIKADSIPVPTAESRFAANQIITDLPDGNFCPIIPTPVSCKKSAGEFTISENTKIFYQSGLQSEAAYLQSALNKLLAKEIEIQEGAGSGIQLSTGIVSGTHEAYSLNITPKQIAITGSDKAGVFYGIQSLRALLPVTAYAKNSGSVSVPAYSINDNPRFAYRGTHLDVARNFHKKESILKLLDLMSFYKLNRFQFHLTDDEGWRVEIPGLPELTDVGSKRGHTKDEQDMLMPAYGSGPFADANNSFGTGYYSKADFIEILKYAAARHIEVVPELDFPGHARAAIVSMKARYNKYIKTDAAKAKEFLLSDPNDKSQYYSIQNYRDNITNVCQESTYKFLEKVVDELSKMYGEAGLKLNMVHTGGDEVPEGAWEGSPVCVDFMNKSDKYKNPEDLFYYFVSRFSKILASKNITTSGWEEIALNKQIVDGKEEVTPNMEFAGNNFVPFVWNTVWGWGGEDRAYHLANFGYKVVLSNVNNLYFDLAVDKDPQENGYYWGGFVGVRKPWDFVPFDISKGSPQDRMGRNISDEDLIKVETLSKQGKTNILGIQGQLWSETVKGPELMEYMMFPKLICLAERAWAQDPAWASIDDRDQFKKASDAAWNSFANTLGKRDLARLEYLAADQSVQYRIPVPGAKIEHNTLEANAELPGFTILYSYDKSKADGWIQYKGAVPVQKGAVVYLKCVSATKRESRIITVSNK
ncbi:MAG: family 20 glycosylhydrolase [Flavobacteriales bacterium]